MMAAASSTFTAAILLFTVAFVAAHHVVDGRLAGMTENDRHVDDLVAKACTNASFYYSQKEMTQEFCESTLRSDKRSTDAKVPRDLAVIALDLLQHSAADAAAKIAGYRKGKEAVLDLDYCLVDYNELAQTIPLCRAAVQKYKADGDVDMFTYFNCADRLMDAAKDCWEDIYFKIEYGGMTKDVWGQVKEASHRATLVKAMVEQMIGETDFRDHDN